MRFVVDRAKTAQVLAVVGRAVPSRHAIPALANLLVTAHREDAQVTFHGTNLDMWLTGRVDAESIDDDFSFTVPANPLRAFVDRAGAEAITVKLEGSSVVVSAGRAKIKLPTTPVEDFPIKATTGLTDYGEVDAQALARLIGLVAFAAENQGGRPVLDAVCWVGGATGMTMAGMNGHLLAVATTPVAVPAFGPFLIPAKTMSMIPRIWDLGNVMVSSSESYVLIRGDRYYGMFRQIGSSDPFPRFDEFLVRARGKNVFTVEAEALQAASVRAGILAGDVSKRVRLGFSPVSLNVSMQGADKGEVEDELEVNGPVEVSTGINHRYLSEIVSAIPAGKMRVVLGGERDPMIFEPADWPISYAILVSPMAETGGT